MRIVQIANFYTPTSGGLRTFLEETGLGYRAAGHDRVLIVPGQSDDDEETPAGRRVTVRSPRVPGLGGYRVLTDRRRVLALLDEVRPDVLEVSDKLSLSWLAAWGRRNGSAVVLFSHERIDAILLSRVPSWFPLPMAANVVNRRLVRMVDRVIVASAFSAAEFSRIHAANVRRIPLGVDLATFRPAAHPVTAPSPGIRLVMVSRLSREKCPERAIDAVRHLKESGVRASLLIVGDGPMRQRLERHAGALPVRFAGHLSDRRAVADLIAGADVAVSPSPAETFGLATLEALACGTPAVVPAQGAANELLDAADSGAVCDGTAADIAAAVRRLIRTPVASRRAAARAAAERYTWSATVSGLLAGYAELTTGTPAAVPPSSR